ncbi:MAG: D-glycero-beta-D-manno-heptose 1,7-bisphosphate 7-phosphatase [Methylococcaceae bacterium]|nr:MAG: D-glycero-beta-D-manno-heptose 1,7-bisphosphate 7-phosphatase [Methylococcaceae bacterium]
MPWIILDRDGVINQDSDNFIKSPAEWNPLPRSIEAMALLNRHGFRIAVLTNQSGIARGYFDLATLAAMHDKLHRLLQQAGGRVERIYVCPHGPDDGCACRKPKPGLFQQFAADTGADLRDLPAIGDSYRDLQAAAAVGCQPILVKTGKGRRTLAQHPHLPYPVYEDLYDAAQHLIA